LVKLDCFEIILFNAFAFFIHKSKKRATTAIDNFKALKFYQKACGLNSGSGCSILGYLYGRGKGVKQDDFKGGLNENHNGLLRQFFPKRMALDNVSEKEAFRATDLMNNRPRKCLGYKTPFEVFAKMTGEDYFLTFTQVPPMVFASMIKHFLPYSLARSTAERPPEVLITFMALEN
jgi:hypothetical protein